MLEQMPALFDQYEKKLVFSSHKRKTYEANVEAFCKEHGKLLSEMIDFISAREDKDAAADEIAMRMVDAVNEKYRKWGRVSVKRRTDLGFYLIYYVFPALLLKEEPEGKLLADHIRDIWNREMKEKISYADYETIRASFQDKLLGIITLKDD